MGLEASLWSWLAKSRAQIGAALQIDRVENMVTAGMPDVEGFLGEEGHGQFWIELKAKERPARVSTPIRFPIKKREEQIEWLRKRWELGGNAYWLLQVGTHSDRSFYLAPGYLGAKLRDGLMEAELAVECIAHGALWLRGTNTAHLTASDIIRRVSKCRAQ